MRRGGLEDTPVAVRERILREPPRSVSAGQNRDLAVYAYLPRASVILAFGTGPRAVILMRLSSGCTRLHLEMRPRYYVCMATTTIGFAVADEDRDRLDRLVEHFGAGNRSAFFRAALPVMEALARADRLRELQARNAERTAAAGLDRDSLLAAIQASYKTGRDSQ
jgi:Arc/MetJ-type ribon-helix-helix transcriptional regulator